MTNDKKPLTSMRFWILVWTMGVAGQLCWNMENQWFNTFIYAKIAKDPTIISCMVAVSAIATAISTFVFGTWSDRVGKRKPFVVVGYLMWGIFTILFGMTQYINTGSSALVLAASAAVIADAIMSFFGSMGNDAGFNAWMNDNMTPTNRGHIGAASATQPIIGTIVGTVAGGILVGENDNYMLLFVVMGLLVIILGIVALFGMKDAGGLKKNIDGTFTHQLLSVFNFKKFFAMKELVWVNITLACYFIAFNMYFTHIGNYIIYYLGFSADKMGLIEGVGLILAMAVVIPTSKYINLNKYPLLCTVSIVLNFLGVMVLGLFVRPENVDVTTIFNIVPLLGIFLIGAGYVLFLQTITVWSKELYPANARGQFEGIRIIFFVLIPMIVAPLISNPIIKQSGQYIDENGFVAYLPTYVLFLVAAVLILITFIPLVYASRYHDRRMAESVRLTK